MNRFDQRHLTNVRYYQWLVDRIFQEAAKDSADLSCGMTAPDDGIFSFEDYPRAGAQLAKLQAQMAARLEMVVVDGIAAEWALSKEKNDALCDTVLAEQVRQAKYYRTNTEARDAFIARKESGLTLSDRVWRYTDQFKNEIELGIDLGLREGLDAPAMARQLKQYLQHPDKLFRRVRDEHGSLQLSQRAAAFHPGQGVYRSSYKNARRLAATETNIAYRTADHERWQQLDFIVGIEVHLSNNHTCLGKDGKPHPFYDICDELKGKYPKGFKFMGWHPHCRCIATTILKTDAEMDADDEAILRGEPLDGESVNKVEDVPHGFKMWVSDNATRIIKARQLPYFMTDNSQYVTDFMQRVQPNTKIADIMLTDHFWRYAPNYKYMSDRFDNLYDRLMSGEAKTDIGKAMLVNQIKQECARLAVEDLRSFGLVDEEWVFARSEFNAVIHAKKSYIVNGQMVDIPETLLDMVVFKDKAGREFAYPVGATSAMFSAKEASKAIDSFPPYLSRGIKRVTFLDIPCPADPYWRVKYNNPKHQSMATDGGKTTFFATPEDTDAFKGYMAHEAGHIIDGAKHRFSSSKAWLEAVAKDDEIYKGKPVRNRVSKYALTNDSEDFAECMRAYITDHDFFKQCFPNRAAYIRRMAQQLSGHFSKRP